MDTVVATILVCGVLNVIPWLLLAYFRPDRSIDEQVKQIDSGLAMVAQALFERLDSLENLADSVPENPFAALLAQFFQQRIAGNDLYGRSEDGTFDGTTIEAEIPPQNTNQP
jgi:ABC-type phosphate transport system auxiliary subunit